MPSAHHRLPKLDKMESNVPSSGQVDTRDSQHEDVHIPERPRKVRSIGPTCATTISDWNSLSAMRQASASPYLAVQHDQQVVPELPEGVPPRTGYGDEEVAMLRDTALQRKAQGHQDVDTSPIPENTYRTPKEKIAAVRHLLCVGGEVDSLARAFVDSERRCS